MSKKSNDAKPSPKVEASNPRFRSSRARWTGREPKAAPKPEPKESSDNPSE